MPRGVYDRSKTKAKWGKRIGVKPKEQAVMNQIMREAVDRVVTPGHLKVMDLKYNPHFEEDMVNHPSHYTFSEYEVVDVADAWYPDEPHLWNANKYMARWNKKGDPVENLEKAIWYLKRKLNILKERNTE